MGEEVPTGVQVKKVENPSGGFVMVRRLRRSEKGSAVIAAGVTSDSVGALMKLQELQVRMAVTGGEGLTLEGHAVEIKPVSHPTLGRLVSADVYDALDQAAVDEIAAFSFASHLSLEQLKN